MVVAFLEAFFKQNNLFVKTNIKELVNKKTCDGDSKSQPVIIFDASSAFCFFSSKLGLICNGNVKELKTNMEKFILNILNLGIKLTVVLRGYQQRNINDWGLKVKQLNKTISKTLASNKEEKQNLKKVVCENIYFGCFHLLKYFSSENYEVLVSDTPTHIYIANLLKKEKYCKCLAVLGQDSNFIIHNQIKTYIELKNLNLHNLDCFVNDRDEFLKMLDLNLEHLPLFASLCGNEITKHIPKNFSNETKTGFHHFFDIANKIKKTNGNLKLLIDNNYQDIIDKSLRMYAGEWEKEQNLSTIQFLALQKCKESNIYQCICELLIHKTHRLCPNLEAFDQNTRTCSEIFIDLRKSLYGILFSEDVEVKEYEWKAKNNFTPEIIQVTPTITCSIIDLWTHRDEKTEQKKWEIFGSVVSLDSSILKMIPSLLFIPVTALHYVYNLKTKYRIISDLEVDCLLTVTIKIALFSYEDEIKVEFPDYDVIDLSTKFLNCCYNLILINAACGEIYDNKTCQTINYFDGVLFQDIYKKMHNGVEWVKFFEKPQKVKPIFRFLKKIVCNKL